MCGICGKYNFKHGSAIRENVIRDMAGMLSHRGPDDEGCFIDRDIALGVRRLSIIDRPGGGQPMRNEDGSIQTVFNGEIYNFRELKDRLVKKGHRFYNKSDTEIIPHLYEEKGLSCLDELNGMFAFALWDKRQKRLFIARDRLGIKPFFYTVSNGSIVFASEIKAILQDPGVKREADLASLHNYLSYNYIPSPRTLFKDIYKLPAGSYMECLNGRVSVSKYWDIRYENEFGKTEDSYVEEFYGLLMKSVKRRLISDVPLGVFLSGGMDSSSLLFCMSKLVNRPIKTFSIGFREKSYDERPFSRIMSGQLGTEHREIMLEPGRPEVLRDIVWSIEGAVANTTAIPLYYLSKFAKGSVTVALSGLGGDEILAGYDTYVADILAGYYRKLPKTIRGYAASGLANVIPVSEKANSLAFKLRHFISGAGHNPERIHYWWRQIFSEDEKRSLYKGGPLDDIAQEDPFGIYKDLMGSSGAKAPINRFLYADTKTWLTDSELMITDMMGMAHSLEIRVPFLDHEIVEFMARVPSRMKLNALTKKYILKKAMKNKLPGSILKRQKRGFSVPSNKWLKGGLKDMVLDVMSPQRISKIGYFNRSYIEGLLEGHFSGRADNSRKIWGLLSFFLWYNIFIEGEVKR